MSELSTHAESIKKINPHSPDSSQDLAKLVWQTLNLYKSILSLQERERILLEMRRTRLAETVEQMERAGIINAISKLKNESQIVSLEIDRLQGEIQRIKSFLLEFSPLFTANYDNLEISEIMRRIDTIDSSITKFMTLIPNFIGKKIHSS